jgi:hypothetical protein
MTLFYYYHAIGLCHPTHYKERIETEWFFIQGTEGRAQGIEGREQGIEEGRA